VISFAKYVNLEGGNEKVLASTWFGKEVTEEGFIDRVFRRGNGVIEKGVMKKFQRQID
jgi:hypothetical protein